MRFPHRTSFAIAFTLLIVSSTICNAIQTETNQPVNDIQLPALFSNHAVLQRNKPIHIWGWAKPEQCVTVQIAGNKTKTNADKQGNWSAYLPALPAGGPYTLTITGTQTIKLSDILIGDIWVCSGQSNMEWPLSRANNASQEVADANYPKIRAFYVPHKYSNTPQNDIDTSWEKCSPENIGKFSAVGYFFGRNLHQNLNIPIGLIGSNLGGTAIEPWISIEGFKSEPKCQNLLELIQLQHDNPLAINGPYIQKVNQWCQKYAPEYAANQGLADGYAKSDFNDSQWSTMSLPCSFESQNIKDNGAIWFRKKVTIPKSWIGQPITLNLGRIDDFDQTYVNGELVGSTGSETFFFWSVHRQYTIPAELVQNDTITITVRAFDNMGNGGLLGPAEKMKLSLSKQSDSITLAGTWKYKIDFVLDPTAPRRPSPPVEPNRNPTGLFNGMIAPLTPYPITGAIWYQGESNSNDGYFYRTLMPLLIKDWRNHWNQPDMPFFLVQLANYGPGRPTRFEDAPPPRSSHWGLLRESQLLTTLSTPKTGMAVTIDIGDAEDIHPRNKQDVGLRLALAARAIEYNQSIVYSGPIYDHMKIEGDKIRIYFKHTANGLVAKDGPLEWVSIAGKDQKFVWADAIVDGDTIVVHSDKVPNPVAVRYAWENNPQGCNLENSAGLPASPFRTDNWNNW